MAGIAERGADAVGYAYRGIRSRRHDSQAAIGRDRAARRHRAAAGCDRGPRPRARLHQGPSDDPRQQPPDPARIGRRHPQRDHRQRRGDLRPLRLRTCRARDDRRLGGDLRADGGDVLGSGVARGAAGHDGDGLARRAELPGAPPRARGRTAALDRPGPAGAVLRVDEVRARGGRGSAAADAAKARGRRRAAAPPRAGQDPRARRDFGRIAPISRTPCSRR